MKVLKKVTAIVCLAAVAGTLGLSNLAAPEVTYAADTNHDDWLHTDKDKILDMNGNEVWLTGANWFGFNCTENVFHGAWYDVKGIVKQIADRGINIIRVPISSELMVSWMNGTPLPVSSVTASNNPPYHVCNPDFADPETGDTKNSWEIFQYVVQYCKEYGVKILMDAHSPHSDNSGHSWELWYGKGGVDTKDWIDSWVWLAEQFKDDDTILAFDLENEPHGKRGYDAGCPDSIARWDDTKLENNWKYAAETCGKAILDVNPNLLILVEGIEQYPKTEKGYTFDTPDVWGASGDASPWYGAWWGGNLRGVRDYPINFGSDDYNDQLVYSPHDYGPSVYNQTWFDKDFTTQTLLDDYWYDTWAYIDAEGIAPLLIGEWGGHMDGGKNQSWMELLRDYMIENRINHTFWCINPNSGDTGGLIGNDWSTWDDEKYGLFEKSLWQDKGGVYIGLDHMTALGENGQSLNQYYGGSPSETVTTPKVTTTTTTTTTPKVTTTTVVPPEELIYGDVNGDGVVEMTDLTMVSQNLIGDIEFTEKQILLADVNGDGGYNLADLGHLKQYVMKEKVVLGPQPK
ncbi:MAG: cellulase family glycosylhydrolase [Oscillospiraceae bacterium]|nr:cellulase family glycosylhydrolase [Oscillospiraceae bacterium]